MPRWISIKNINEKNTTPIRAQYCADFFSRLRGFTFRRNIHWDEGLLLVERQDSRINTSIHMLFVWTDLAVFWIDSNLRVVDKVLARSWMPFYASREPSRYVLELNPGRLNELEIGDFLEFLIE